MLNRGADCVLTAFVAVSLVGALFVFASEIMGALGQ